MLKTSLTDIKDGRQLLVTQDAQGQSVLAVSGPYDVGTRVAAESRSTAGTTTVISPDPSGYLIIHDLIISAKRSNGTSVVINMTDGTNTIVLLDLDNTDGITFHIPLAVPWTAWGDAYLDVVTDGSFNCNVSISYAKLNNGLSYEEWAKLT